MKFNFYIDDSNISRAEIDEEYKLLARFLEEDMQRNPLWRKELICIVGKVNKNEVDSREGTGNANTLKLSSNKVIIENEFTG